MSEISYRLWNFAVCVGCGKEFRIRHLHKLPYTFDGRQAWGRFCDKCAKARLKERGE